MLVDDRFIGLDRFRIERLFVGARNDRIGLFFARLVLDVGIVDGVVALAEVGDGLRSGEAEDGRRIADANINRAAAANARFARPRRDNLCGHPARSREQQRRGDDQVESD